MDWKTTLRALGGLLGIVTLVALLVADFWFQTRSVPDQTILVLLTLISAMLGIDILSSVEGLFGGRPPPDRGDDDSDDTE